MLLCFQNSECFQNIFLLFLEIKSTGFEPFSVVLESSSEDKKRAAQNRGRPNYKINSDLRFPNSLPEFILFRILIKQGSQLLKLDDSRLEYIWYGCSHLLFSRWLCFISSSIHSHSWEFWSYSHEPDPGWGRTQAISLFLQSLCHVLLTLAWAIGMKTACIINIQNSFPLSLDKTGSRAGVSGDSIAPFLRNQQRNSVMENHEGNLNNLMLWFLLWSWRSS